MAQVSGNYQDWLAQNSLYLAHDPVWRFVAYPKSLWLFDLVWQDCEIMKQTAQSRAFINQIIRSTDSISANIDEGFGRGIERKEYTQFLRIALGSARETRSRYYKLRPVFSQATLNHRMKLCNEIIAILTTTIHKRNGRN